MRATKEMAQRLVAESARCTEWEGLRGLQGPGSAWPSYDEPMLEWLFDKAQELRATTPKMTWADTLRWAILHGWYEGHIEGYDHGQRDARADS
jgi:hypothetical protein